MDVRPSRWPLAVALICAMSLFLFQGCGKAPWRFEDMRGVVDEVDPASLGEVVHDEESGTEYVGGEVAHREIEILMVGSPRAVRAQVSDLYEPGEAMPSGVVVPEPNLGVFLNMGY